VALQNLRITLAAAAIVLAASPVAARMPAAAFLKKADSLRAKGPFALFSPDLKKLQFEAEAAGDELHDEHAAKMAAHEPTDWCAPVTKYLGPRELIVGMHAIAPAELGRMDIKQAMRTVFERNYPCPK
jgi:hypothetical protein